VAVRRGVCLPSYSCTVFIPLSGIFLAFQPFAGNHKRIVMHEHLLVQHSLGSVPRLGITEAGDRSMCNITRHDKFAPMGLAPHPR
jgi:hypothetical protein